MAKTKTLTCPWCGAKTTDDNGKYASHSEGDRGTAQCVMTGRPVEGREQGRPVTDGPTPT